MTPRTRHHIAYGVGTVGTLAELAAIYLMGMPAPWCIFMLFVIVWGEFNA